MKRGDILKKEKELKSQIEKIKSIGKEHKSELAKLGLSVGMTVAEHVLSKKSKNETIRSMANVSKIATGIVAGISTFRLGKKLLEENEEIEEDVFIIDEK